MTTIYIDTEFSQPDDRAELISLGAVTADGAQFYAELVPLPECSDFVRANVLPLFDGGDVACARDEFLRRFALWLHARQVPRKLIADSSWDLYVLRKFVVGKGNHHLGGIEIEAEGVLPVPVMLTVTPPLGQAAQDIYDAAVQAVFDSHAGRQHHALVDALALRAGDLAIARKGSK